MQRRARRRRRGRGRRCRWCRTRRRPAPLRRSRPAGRASPPRPGRRPRPRRPGCRPPDGRSRRPGRRRRGARGPARRAVRTGGCPYRCPSAPPRRLPHRGGPGPVLAAPWPRPCRHRLAAPGRGHAPRAMRHPVRSLPTARREQGSGPSSRRVRRRHSSFPSHRPRRYPTGTSCPFARRRTCRCARSRAPSMPALRSRRRSCLRPRAGRCRRGSTRPSRRSAGRGAAGARPPGQRPPLDAAHRWCPRRRSADGCSGRRVPGP